MKVSRILLAGLAGAVLVYTIRRMMGRRTMAAVVNEILFDTEFLPGTRKINQFIPDNPEMRNWFRTRQGSVPDEEGMFI